MCLKKTRKQLITIQLYRYPLTLADTSSSQRAPENRMWRTASLRLRVELGCVARQLPARLFPLRRAQPAPYSSCR